LLKVIIEHSVEVLYLVIELVLPKIGFSTRQSFAASIATAIAVAAARKRECHADDYCTQYRKPKSHIQLFFSKIEQIL